MLDHRMAGKPDLAGNAQGLGNADPALEIHAGIRLDGGDAVELLEEVEMPEGAAELAIGHALEANRFLLGDQRLDLAILDRLEPLGAERASGALLAGFLALDLPFFGANLLKFFDGGYLPLGVGAVRIGRIVADHPGLVVARTALGGARIVPMPLGEQLPRIC